MAWSTRQNQPTRHSDPGLEAALAEARRGCAASRWRVLADCCDYLRFAARQGGWSRTPGGGRTSDLVHRTIVDAWRKFSAFQGTDDRQLRGWVKAILINAARNDRRNARPIAADAAQRLEALPGGGPSPDQEALAAERTARVDAALARLGRRDQAVIRLRIWDELGFAEVGRRLGLSEDAARMCFARAVDRLRKQMRGGDGIG